MLKASKTCYIHKKAFYFLQDDCHQFATCADTGPGTHKCTCNEGYTGDGKIICRGNNILKCSFKRCKTLNLKYFPMVFIHDDVYCHFHFWPL